MCKPSAAYLYIRVWRYPLEVASSLEVRSIVQHIRSPFKNRDEVHGLTPVQTCTCFLASRQNKRIWTLIMCERSQEDRQVAY